MISTKKFAILEAQKKELQENYDEPVFIDIEAEKLYIINSEGFNQYIF